MLLSVAIAVLLQLVVTRECVSQTVPLYDVQGFFVDLMTHEDRARLRACPCPNSGDLITSLCLPVDFAGKKPRKEVFAFSVAADDRWKHYDWDQCQLTTVAWNEDKELLCHAHSKGVKVVVKHNFDDVDQLCNITARNEWIQVGGLMMH
ncbi:Di-N-acetylchitobiase, partial [Phytophthora palmivora]